MTIKISDLLAEVSALESNISKTASAKPSKKDELANVLDKLAEDMGECESSEEKEEKSEDEESKEEEKEASMKLTPDQINKIAAAVVKNLEKIAVDSGPNTQGSVVNEGAKASDGKATSAARATDQIVSGDSVAAAAASNPEANNKGVEGRGDLIADEPINSVGGGFAEPLKQASVTYTAQEAAVLQKLASIGYEYVVEVESDKIVREKIASAVIEEQARTAPAKIAQAIVRKNTEKTAGDNMVSKLAAIRDNDPQLFNALRVLADRKMI